MNHYSLQIFIPTPSQPKISVSTMSSLLRIALSRNYLRFHGHNKSSSLAFRLMNSATTRTTATTSTTTKTTLLISSSLKRNYITIPLRLMSSVHGNDHSKLWIIEKAISAALLAIIPAAFAFQSNLLDYALALSLVVHTHWGLEAMVVDYIRPSLVGPVIPKIALASLYALSVAALAGLFYLNYSDVGLSTAVNMFIRL